MPVAACNFRRLAPLFGTLCDVNLDFLDFLGYSRIFWYGLGDGLLFLNIVSCSRIRDYSVVDDSSCSAILSDVLHVLGYSMLSALFWMPGWITGVGN